MLHINKLYNSTSPLEQRLVFKSNELPSISKTSERPINNKPDKNPEELLQENENTEKQVKQALQDSETLPLANKESKTPTKEGLKYNREQFNNLLHSTLKRIVNRAISKETDVKISGVLIDRGFLTGDVIHYNKLNVDEINIPNALFGESGEINFGKVAENYNNLTGDVKKVATGLLQRLNGSIYGERAFNTQNNTQVRTDYANLYTAIETIRGQDKEKIKTDLASMDIQYSEKIDATKKVPNIESDLEIGER